jgi:hypothetical protein
MRTSSGETTVKPTAAMIEPHERGDACLAHLPGFCLQK